MTYDGRFRDFVVGWITSRVDEPDCNREALENLYDEVVDAENDGVARGRVELALGKALTQRLWNLSEQWYDPTVARAGGMIEAFRKRVQEETRDHTQFYLFFLNPFIKGCVPDGFTDTLEQEISWMFRTLYRTAAAVALEPYGWEPAVVVEPSCEGASEIVVLAHPKANYQAKVFLFHHQRKVWHVRFANLVELAEELLDVCQIVEHCAFTAILGHRVAETVAAVLAERDDVQWPA